MVKVGDKYIIELAEEVNLFDGKIWRVKGFNSLVMDEYGLGKLKSYDVTVNKDRQGKVKDDTAKRKEIISYYGIRMQLFKLIEELNEAQAEVIKMLSGKKDASVSCLIEELADVALMTDQIVEHYGMTAEFNEDYLYKLKRTLKRIDEEKRTANDRQ